MARDIRTLVNWLSHDVLALAGPDLATRRELFDFLVAELAARKPEDTRRIRPMRVALQNQRDHLLGQNERNARSTLPIPAGPIQAWLTITARSRRPR